MKPDIKPLIARLVIEEGYRQFPYKDTKGIETIGIGRNLQSVGIRRKEAEYMLTNDVDEAWDHLVAKFPWVDNLDQVRQRVLLDMTFNMGIDTLSKFTNTLRLVESGQYKDAAANMRESLWAKQVGKRAQNLADIMEIGHE